MGDVMKAVDIKDGTGPVEALFINDATPKPVPKEGEVLVRVKAFGLNRMDLLQREGKYPVPPQAPKTLGVEFSGTISTLGPSTTCSFSAGDEVFGLAYGGAYAEYISVSPLMLLHKPSSLSWEVCAAIPEVFMTATQALHLIGSFKHGDSVLWHAGASSVSLAGLQLSLDSGASEVYATAGTDEKCRYVESLGAKKCFNYKTTDWAAEILKITNNKGVDIIMDYVGATYFTSNLSVIARDGRWVIQGLMGGSKLKDVDIGALLYKRVRIEGSTLRSRNLDYQGKLRDKLGEYMPDFESGKLKVSVDTVLDWSEIQKAQSLLEGNTTMGKIVCTIPWE
ncbi:quinone oxidoreductase putative [Xylariaceae sp. FL1019]|nr:quinone oxidoreductase putative [Xylariaceae sp. FL1019]